jgi:hypothetical protein
MATGNRRCQKGKPCGATCITRIKVCRMNLARSLSDGLAMASGSLTDKDSQTTFPEKQEKKIEVKGATEQYQKDYLDHVERNSAGFSTATFSPRDLANHLVEASNQLEGEAKDNMRRLMEFVVKDRQVLFVSDFGEAKSQRDFTRFARLLESSYPSMKLEFERKVNRLRLINGDLKRLTQEDRERVKNGEEPLHAQRISYAKKELQKIGKEIKEIRDKVFQPGTTAPTGPNNWGYTNPKSRRVIVVDRSSNGKDKFDSGKPVDAKLIAKQMQETMEARASKSSLSPEEQKMTYFIAGRFADGFTTNAYAYVYVHELGHQIDFRASGLSVPNDSVSQGRGPSPETNPESNRGLSKYSNLNFNEAFAEAFSAFIYNPAALRQYDEPMYELVKSNFEKAIQRAGLQIM